MAPDTPNAPSAPAKPDALLDHSLSFPIFPQSAAAVSLIES